MGGAGRLDFHARRRHPPDRSPACRAFPSAGRRPPRLAATAPSSPCSIRAAAATLLRRPHPDGAAHPQYGPLPLFLSATSDPRTPAACSRSSTRSDPKADAAARSRRRPPFGIAYRQMTDDDLPFVAALYATDPRRRIRGDRLARRDAGRLFDQQHRVQHRHYRATYPGADWLIVERGGAPVGRLYLGRNGDGAAADRHLAACPSSAAPGSAAPS